MMIKTRKISHFIAALLIAIVLPFGLSAQDDRLAASSSVVDRYSVNIDFRVNSSTIDEAYRDNATFIACIDSISKCISADPDLQIVSLEICGSASPDGPAELNRRLSNARMMALDSYLRNHIEFPDSIVIHNDQYITWGHLIQLVTEDPKPIARKDEVLAILEQSGLEGRDSWGRKQDGRINAIQALDNGVTWRQLNQLYFEQLRNAWFIMVVVCPVEPEPMPEPIVEAEVVIEPEPTTESVAEAEAVVEPEPTTESVVEAEAVVEPEPTTEPVVEAETVVEPELTTESVVEAEVVVEPELVPTLEPEDEPVVEASMLSMNVKINAAEAAALIANVGFEFRITPRISLDVIGHYSPYNYFNEARKIRVFAIQPELRYWWGEALVQGHFVGLHIPVAGFNVQLNDRYRFQDPNRAICGVGVSYGYAMPLGKSGKWGVELTIGVGYLNIKYDVYEGVHNGKYVRSGTSNYFGPTRLGVDFSYRIDFQKKNREIKTIGE